MKNKSTVSIGIPAFNEEANIGFLLKDLLKQNQKNFVFHQIIISSDGSTDKTIETAKKASASFIQKEGQEVILIDNKERKGRAVRQNQIMERSASDILVLLDADILIKDKNFIEKIIKPVLNKKADLTSVSVQELPPENFLERILKISMEFKKFIFENYKNGNNLYTCHGRARAFSKKLYKTINFKESVGEDAYSYFYTIANGFKYSFVKNTGIFYKLPANFQDHEKQSIRFYKTLSLLEKDFGRELVSKENYISGSLLVKNLMKYIFVNPLIIIYFFIAAFLKIKALFVSDIKNNWSTSESSKSLRKELI